MKKVIFLTLIFLPFFTHALSSVGVEKQWCKCASQTVCNYMICDDGRSGPQCTVLISSNETVRAGETLIITADAGWINAPTYGAGCTAGLGCNTQTGGCGSIINNTVSGSFSGATGINTTTNIGNISANIPVSMTPGMKSFGFSAGTTGNGIPESGNPRYVAPGFSYGELSVTVTPAITQCSDGVNNNDGDNLIDTLDPQCHTDCNVNNIATYLATHNSESVAPNGIICPAPTLQLNGRAAFFQVVKNFFASITARAFAGE